MEPDLILTRSLIDSLAELLAACQERQAQAKLTASKATSSEVAQWFQKLAPSQWLTALTSEEPEWLQLITEMATECRRSPRGNGILFSVDQPEVKPAGQRPGRVTYHRRPRKNTPWGDPVFPFTANENELAAGLALQRIMGVSAVEPTVLTVLPGSAAQLQKSLMVLSHGRFLTEPPTGPVEAPWAEVPWFASRSYSTLGHIIANKVETLVWAHWLQRQGGKGQRNVSSALEANTAMVSFWVNVPALEHSAVVQRCSMVSLQSTAPRPHASKSFVQLRDNLEALVNLSTPLSQPREDTVTSMNPPAALVSPIGWPSLLPLRKAFVAALFGERAAAAERSLIESENVPKKPSDKPKKSKANKKKQRRKKGTKEEDTTSSRSAHDRSSHIEEPCSSEEDSRNDRAVASSSHLPPMRGPQVPQTRSEARIFVMALSVVCDIVDLALASIVASEPPQVFELDPWASHHPTVWGADGPFRGFMSLFGPGPQFTLAVDQMPSQFRTSVIALEPELAPLPETDVAKDVATNWSVESCAEHVSTNETTSTESVVKKDATTEVATAASKETAEPVSRRKSKEALSSETIAKETKSVQQQSPPPQRPQQVVAASPGPRPTMLVRAKSLRVESAGQSSSSPSPSMRVPSPQARRSPQPKAKASLQAIPMPTPQSHLQQPNTRGWETKHFPNRSRGRAISDGDERARGQNNNPTPPRRRWERVPSGGSCGGGGGGGRGSSGRGGGASSGGGEETDEVTAVCDADESLLSEDCGRTISMEDFNDTYFQQASRDGGGEVDDDDANGEPLPLKATRLEEENAVLKDVALRLESEVSKLRNVIAATQGMALNTVQATAYSSVPNNFLLPMGVHSQMGIAPGGGLLETHSEVMSDDGSGLVWPAGNTADRFALPHLSHSNGHPIKRHRRLSMEGTPGNLLSSTSGSKRASPVSVPPLIPERSTVAPLGARMRLQHSSFASRLSVDLALHVAWIDEEERRLRSVKEASFLALRKEVQSLWPRAQVSLYGSFVTALGLPSSDLDLVISLPKVQSLPLAVGPGDLEGRNAIKETWQQNLSRTLRSSSWVDPSSVKNITR